MLLWYDGHAVSCAHIQVQPVTVTYASLQRQRPLGILGSEAQKTKTTAEAEGVSREADRGRS